MNKLERQLDSMDIDTVSVSEMKENFNIIEKNIPIMKKKLSDKLREKEGVLSSIEIEKLIVDSLEESQLAPAGKRILEGFYETWMSIFMMVGNDKESLIVTLRAIGMEI